MLGPTVFGKASVLPIRLIEDPIIQRLYLTEKLAIFFLKDFYLLRDAKPRRRDVFMNTHSRFNFDPTSSVFELLSLLRKKAIQIGTRIVHFISNIIERSVKI